VVTHYAEEVMKRERCLPQKLRDRIRRDRWNRIIPRRNGFWLMRECDCDGATLILLSGGVVADDYEFAAAMGVGAIDPPELNYYEGISAKELREFYNKEFLFVGKHWKAALAMQR
jgi:hypothetical protein